MHRPTTLRRRAVTLAVALAGASALAFAPTGAQAATIINFEHDASGTAYIASTDSSIALGPTTLATALDADTGDISGHLALPGTRTHFEVAGFIPIDADVSFVEAAPIQGHLTFSGFDVLVNATATYYVKLSNIKIAGFPTFTGPYCRTQQPVSIPVNTPAGESFDILGGGTLAGEFSIGDFQNCGLNTWLVNLLVPGSGNELDLQISNGRVV